jgi:hypothetical protein
LVHEIKFDSFRLLANRDGLRVGNSCALPPFHYRRAGSSSVHASQPALPGEIRSLEWSCQPPALERPDQIAPQAQLLVFVAHGSFSSFPVNSLGPGPDPGLRDFSCAGIIAKLVDIDPNSHFLVVTARKSDVAKNRDAYVRFMAGLIETARFMNDANNADRVAEIATVTTRIKEQAKLRACRL